MLFTPRLRLGLRVDHFPMVDLRTKVNHQAMVDLGEALLEISTGEVGAVSVHEKYSYGDHVNVSSKWGVSRPRSIFSRGGSVSYSPGFSSQSKVRSRSLYLRRSRPSCRCMCLPGPP